MKEFEEKRKELEQLQVPADFEARLRTKLDMVPRKKKRLSPWLIAVAVLCLVFASINYPALAFYSKTLFGYEELMSESIQKLNEEGYGQQIAQELTLKDGKVFTVEGVMSDRNQFDLYYAVSGDDEDYWEDFNFSKITGFLKTSNPQSGVFDFEQHKGVQTFEAVNAFSKKLTLSFDYKGQPYELTFRYDANKAIPTTLKKRINKTFEFDYGKLKFTTLYATKANTRLHGTLSEKTDRNLNYDLSQVVLIANGIELTSNSSGMRSAWSSKYDFDITYDALPNDLKDLAIEVRHFNGKETVNQTVAAKTGTYKIGPTEFEILSVTIEEGKTKIRIASETNVLFDNVSISTDHHDIQLAGSENYSDEHDKSERTLIFNTTDKVNELHIGNIYYNKAYSEKINISVK